jgi:hypothetical protein
MREKPHHPSYVRLLEAGAKEGFPDANAVAKALGEGEQTVSNWGRRGVSKNGAQKAQKYFKCDSNWILEGEAAAVVPYVFSRAVAAIATSSSAASLRRIVQLMERAEALRDGCEPPATDEHPRGFKTVEVAFPGEVKGRK